MAVERNTREATDATPTRRGGVQPNEQTVVMVVRPVDVGLKQVKPAGPPTRVGQGF